MRHQRPIHSLSSPLLAACLAAQAPTPLPVGVERSPTLPEAISSFGACRSGGWLYVFGGHVGRAHAHSRDNVVGSFHRLNLADGASWQALPGGPALQGTALVADREGVLYRIGGMTARNAAGAPPDLHSTASVARFDPRLGIWQETTPLPEPRSSHDAAVLGNHLYVVGGWHLHGDEDGSWHRTAWVANLAEQPLRWQPLPSPGEPRRAAALATLCGQLVLLGGMDDDGMLASVRTLDPAAGTWSEGPPLPGPAFGTAAIAVGDRLFASVMDGRMFAWNGVDTTWTEVARLETPRIFHRLAALDDRQLLVLGGGARSGHLRSCERIPLQHGTAPRFHEVVIPSPGQVAQRQALVLLEDTLWALGGNRGSQRDRFAADQFADDIWRIDLILRTADRVATLPHPTQSMAVATCQSPAGAMLVGGLGPTPGHGVESQRAAWRFDPRTTTLHPLATLPTGRTQCGAVQHGNSLWVFGGTDFTPGADGAGKATAALDVLVCDLGCEPRRLRPAGLQLPGPRRSFATAHLDGSVLLLGGLGDDFTALATADVLDLTQRTWSRFELPRAWVSAQAAVLGDRVYIACGGTMEGQRFTEDRSLWSWHRATGWRLELEELPFPVRHAQMLAYRDRLLFYSAAEGSGDRIVIRTHVPMGETPRREAAAATR